MNAKLAPLLTLALLSAGTASQAQVPPGCPFQPEELAKVFGTPFKAGKVDSELALGASRYRECRYKGPKITVRAATTVMGPDWDAVGRFRHPPTTKFAPIAGDPDQARTVTFPSDTGTMPTIQYRRQGIEVELSVLGGVYDPATRDATMRDFQTKLARLRRLP